MLRQYEQMQKMLKQFSNPGKMSKKLRRMGGMPGMGGMPAQAADSRLCNIWYQPADRSVYTIKFMEVTDMAVKIRLRRMGAKKAPFYRIVVADSRYPRDGRFIEEVGYYDPTKEPSVIKVDEEKAKKWISTGAQPTDTVKSLLKIAGVL